MQSFQNCTKTTDAIVYEGWRCRGQVVPFNMNIFFKKTPRDHPKHQRRRLTELTSRAGTTDITADTRKEKLETYKLFDQAAITVRAGNGGKGEIVKEGQGRMVKNFKYTPGGRQPKQIFLPAGEPANGEHGGDVWIVVDPGVDSLAHLHKRDVYNARNGANGNCLDGSRGSVKAGRRASSKAEPLRLFVPPGTVVKTKKGVPLGELLQPGDSLRVARGGQGGLGIRNRSGTSEPSRSSASKLARGIEEYEVEDGDTKNDSKGLPGETIALQLYLSVVADIGIVGLPNAGKSSLLAAMTRASPEVADYPFTTLTPNLGVIQFQEETFDRSSDGDFMDGDDERKTKRATLADLPGLIKGAHTGKGLGRMFLRHLRRTNALLHVLDASADDPGSDFLAVREELRMYNPAYCEKPYLVALNKMDLPDGAELEFEIRSEVHQIALDLQKQHGLSLNALPTYVICTSALDGRGLDDICGMLRVLAEICAV